MTTDNQVFFYVDGIPTKGAWVDMDAIDDWQEVKTALVVHGFCDEDYDGDILAADAEGLCKPFLGRHDTFDLAEFVDCRDHETHAPDEAKIAYVEWMGSWDSQGFDDAYIGNYSRETNPKQAFIYSYVDDAGVLEGAPQIAKDYFDYESYERDRFINDFHEENGFIFYND